MSFVKTWTFALNQAPADFSTILKIGQSYWYQFVTILLANGWTVTFSSNGTVADSNNNWSSAASIVWGATNYSQITLKSPEGAIKGPDGTGTGEQSKVWLTIACKSATTTQVDIIYHITTPTGGTVSAVQTSTAQKTKTNQQYMRTALGATPIFHFAITTEGHFWTGISYTGANVMPFLFINYPFESVTTILSTGKPYPYAYCTYSLYSDSASNPTLTNILSTASNNGYLLDGSAVASSVQGISKGSGTNQPTGNFNGKYVFNPLYMEANIAAKAGEIGKIADFECRVSSAPSNGNSVDGITITRCFIGSMALPANAVVNC